MTEIPTAWAELGRRGAYTTSQAATLIGVSASDVASWLGGRPPIIHSDIPRVAGHLVLTFEALVEARAVAFLLNGGMKRGRLAKIVQIMRRRSADCHPLARERLLTTDGASVIEVVDDRLIDLLSESYLHPEVLRPALSGRVVFKSGRAAWLEPDPLDLPLVRIDPRRAFGRPVVVDGETTVPTATLANLASADGTEEAADWHGVTEAAVSQAVEFERRLAA
ncbi:MAG: hypothetical protein JWM33_2455 [Caulobacteraceae bacterium]|nr:hypothetical protein [Caulobacteraceae bacterium]